MATEDEILSGIDAAMKADTAPTKEQPEAATERPVVDDANEDATPEVKADTTPEKEVEAKTKEAETEPSDATSEEEGVEVPDSIEGLAAQFGVEEAELSEHIKVRVNGSALPVAEVAKGYLRQDDYTNKTKALSEDRKAMEAEKIELSSTQQRDVQYLYALNQEIEGLLGSVEIPAGLEHEDPDRFNTLRWQKWENEKKIGEVKSKIAWAQEQLTAQREQAKSNFYAEQSQKLTEKWPGVTKEDVSKVREFIRDDYGFTDEEAGDFADARGLVLIRDFMKAKKELSEIKDKTPIEMKKMKRLPKALKPGVARDSGSEKTDRVVAVANKLRRSGTDKDAHEMAIMLGLGD